MKEIAYLVQVVLILAWWIGLSLSNAFSAAFQFPGVSDLAFRSFLLPDLLGIATLSLIRVYKPSIVLQHVILGAFLYATLYCINASILGRGGVLPTLLMLAGLAYNGFLCLDHRVFRNAKHTSKTANGLKTLVQIVCIWFVTLIAIPYVILSTFGEVNQLWSGNSRWFAAILFTSSSTLGLWSAFVFVRDGDGTPLPLDQTNRLVTNGPYRWIRNPMATAGIGQGLAVSIAFQSIPVLVYSLLGALAWQIVVKPIEERDLENRFGDAYLDYRKRVGLWIPRRQSFRPLEFRSESSDT